MDTLASLNHSVWDCKYHVVFIPKCRRRTLYGELRRHLGEVFRQLALQKQSRIEEGHLLPDHVHMLIAIPPKYAVAQVVGFIKGKSAIHLARVYGERKRNFVGNISGRAVTSCRPWAGTNESSGSTSRSRNRKTRAWTSWDSGGERRHRVGGGWLRGALAPQ
jgi:putative transposase